MSRIGAGDAPDRLISGLERVGFVCDDRELSEAYQAAADAAGVALTVLRDPRETQEIGPNGAHACLVHPYVDGVFSPARLEAALVSSQLPQLRVVLAEGSDGEAARAAMRLGAAACMTTDASAVYVLGTLAELARGGAPYHPGLVRQPDPQMVAKVATLSRRERQVFVMTAQGYTGVETARELGIGAKSVETYRARAFEKLEVGARSEVVRAALDALLI